MAASDLREVTQDMPSDPKERGGRGLPNKGYNSIRQLIIFKRGVLINPNTQFSFLHFLSSFLSKLAKFQADSFHGFGIMEETHTLTDTDAHTFISLDLHVETNHKHDKYLSGERQVR